MSRTRPSFRRTLATIALAPAAAAIAADGDPAGQDLERRLQRLEAQVEQLRTGDDGWLSDARAEEIRALVGDVLGDADVRASLLADEITAGYDGGFFIRSADGRAELEISGQLQHRLTWNRRIRRTDDVDTRADFELRRTKIKFDGSFGGGAVGYTIGAAFDDTTGIVNLQSFNVRFALSDGWRLAIGRARPPLLREESISSKRQLAAERSLVTRTFDQSRTLGVSLRYAGERIRFHTGLMDASTDDLDSDRYRVSARAELLIDGKWKRLEDFTSFPDDEMTVAFGAGLFFQHDEIADPTVNDGDLFRWSSDVTVEWGGANLFASVIGSRRDEETRGTLNQWGLVVQGGRFLGDHWELFGRYEWGEADGESEELSLLTVGVNYYFARHEHKWTLDVGYGINEVGDFWASSGAGWRGDRRGQNDQVVARTQVQLLF